MNAKRRMRWQECVKEDGGTGRVFGSCSRIKIDTDTKT